MITNFEDITYNITEEEKKIAILIAKSLEKNHVGKSNIINRRQIIIKLANAANPTHRINMGDARLRKIINYIRQTGLCNCLIGTSRGYYVANTREEMGDYIKSLSERINEITKIQNAMILQMDLIPYVSVAEELI